MEVGNCILACFGVCKRAIERESYGEGQREYWRKERELSNEHIFLRG